MNIGAIEAGGTKMVCAIVNEQGQVLDRATFPTTTPGETTKKMIEYFQDKNIERLGIASFGPVDLNKKSASYGYIMKTPKPGWTYFDMVGTFMKALKVPVGFDTDVNGAILGEVRLGAARGCDNAIYITIGTGIGVGVYCNGSLMHGLTHPEAGHILIGRHPADDEERFTGVCPFHKNCFEGLASGPSIQARWGKPAAELAENREVWELESFYIAQAITNYVLSYSPEKIVLWGGVMHQPNLINYVRIQVKELLGGYVSHMSLDEDIDSYIVEPELGENAGIIGAAMLGLEA